MKIIALDMDGTLLNSHQEITPYTKDTLISMQKKGYSIVLSSGRDIKSLKTYGNILKFNQFPQSGYICLNGLEIYNANEELLHKENGLTYQDAKILEQLAKRYHLDMIFFFKDCLYIIQHGQTGIVEHHFVSSTKYVVNDTKDIPQEYFNDLRKIAYIQTKETMKTILPSLQQEVNNLFDICLVEENWVEVNPYQIHKGYALKTYANIKNISLQHVIAFGNGENDIEMLKVAGKGVAMGNSFANVKKIADDVCDDCEHDGIVKYLLNHL